MVAWLTATLLNTVAAIAKEPMRPMYSPQHSAPEQERFAFMARNVWRWVFRLVRGGPAYLRPDHVSPTERAGKVADEICTFLSTPMWWEDQRGLLAKVQQMLVSWEELTLGKLFGQVSFLPNSDPLCKFPEAQAKYYLPQMFGHNNYNILPKPSELPAAFSKFYKRIIND